MTLNFEGEKFDLCAVVIYPLISEATLGLDILSKCTVDLSQQHLIVHSGNVVIMSCQTKEVEWKCNLNKLERVNTEACKDQCKAPENRCMLNNEVRSEDTEIFSRVVDTCDVEDHPSTVESSSTQCDRVFSVRVIDNLYQNIYTVKKVRSLQNKNKVKKL